MRIQKIDHFVITTAHLDACLRFYEALGFTVQKEAGRYALLAGEFKINVHSAGMELLPHAGVIQPGSADLCFEIAGGLALAQEVLRGKGIAVVLGIVERHGVRGAMQSIYLRDPDDNLIELCQYDSPV